MNEPDRSEGAGRPTRDEPTATIDQPSGSVTGWIGDLKAGDERALQSLWDRYYAVLVERARSKLGALRGPTAANDDEDVALSAFHSLYQGISEGRFPRLDDRDDTLRRIAELKLACFTNDEIRSQLGCSLRSVTLTLKLIRKKWQKLHAAS